MARRMARHCERSRIRRFWHASPRSAALARGSGPRTRLKPYRRFPFEVALGCLLALASSCTQARINPLLLGSWQNEDGSLTMTFQQDGTLLMAQPKVPGDQPVRARFTAVDDAHLNVSFGSGSGSRSVEVISLSPHELVIRDWDGQIGKFRKIP